MADFIAKIRLLQDRRGDMQRLIGRMKLLNRDTNHQLQAALHQDVQAFKVLGDSAFHDLEEIRIAARTQLEHFEYTRLSSILVKCLNEVETLILTHIDDEKHDIEERRSHFPMTTAGIDPTDLLIVSLSEVDAQEEIIKERENGIAQIQRDVRSLRGMFQDMGYHVNQQSSLIDNIEINITSASDRTNRANEELSITRNRIRRSTRTYAIALLLLIVVIVVTYFISKKR